MATYDITALGSALEFETTNLATPSIVRLPGLDRVVIAWYQSLTVCNVQAFNVNKSTGAITAIGSPVDLEIATISSAIYGLSLTVIDSSNLAIFQSGGGNDGFTQLLSLDGTGNISVNGSRIEFDISNSTDNTSVLMDATHILNIWSGVGSNGYAQIFTVDTGAGTITATGTAFEFDVLNYLYGKVKKISSTKAIVFYSGEAEDGFSIVLDINTSTWAVTAAGSAFEFAATTTNAGNSCVLMSDGSPMVVVNGWTDTALADAIVKTFQINTSTWAITAFGSELALSTAGATIRGITIQKLDDTHIVAFYSGTDGDGFARVLTYNTSTGELTTTANEIEFETADFSHTDSVDFTETSGFFVNVWSGVDVDGYVQAFQVDVPRYWVGGTGNWSDTSHWSLSSGGAGGASVPTSGNDVVFDANSFSVNGSVVTLDTVANCRALNSSATDQTFTITSSTNALNIYGDITENVNNSLYAFTGTAYVYIKGNCTITTNGRATHAWNQLAIDGSGITVTNADDFNVGNTQVWLANGTWNTNNKTITVGGGFFTSTGTKTLTLGTSTFNIGRWFNLYSAGFTFNYNTSTVNINAPSNLQGANTFYNLTFTGTAETSAGIALFSNITVNNTLTIAGSNNTNNRFMVSSYPIGTTKTITCNGTISASNVDFREIVGAGSASWDLSAITGLSGDCGGNSGITFTTAVAQYWHVGTGSWSDTSKWFTATNGGGSAGRVPLPQDDVYFDASSFDTTGTLTVNCARIGKSLNMSGVAYAVTMAFSNNVESYGSYIIGNNITPSGNYTVNLLGRSTYDLNLYGKTFYALTINGSGATYTNLADFTITNTFRLYLSTFDVNDFNITSLYFYCYSGSTIYLGNGLITVSAIASTNGFFFQGTVYCEGSTLKMVAASGANNPTFDGYDNTFNNVWFSGTHTGYFVITGSNTFNELKIDAGRKIKFTASTTQTVNTFTAIGTTGNLITLDSTTTGTYNLTKAGGGYVSAKYIDVQHSIARPWSGAGGDDTWYAGTNSVNNQATSTAGDGWLFTEAPTLSSYLISHWKLEQNTLDSVGNFDGTAYGSLGYSSSGKIGYAGSFVKTTNDYIEGTFGGGTSTIFTVSAWIKTSTVTTNQGIAGYTDNNGLRREINLSDGKLRVFVSGGYYTGTTSLNDGNWHFVVGGYTGSSYFMYIDGSTETGSFSAYTSAQTADRFRIGHIQLNLISNGYMFDGLIDEVSIWSKALTGDEVTELYNSGNGVDYPFVSSSISSSPSTSISTSLSSSPSSSPSTSISSSPSSSLSSSPSSSPSSGIGVYRTGSAGSIQSSSNSGSQSITVPSDAEILVVAVGGYTTVSSYFSGGTVTLNSSTLSLGVAREDGGGNEMVIFYIVNPSTGTQTLAWDWIGTTAVTEGAQIMYAFYKGVNTSNPIRSTGASGGVNATASASTGTMTAVSGDMAVVGLGFFNDVAVTWTNATMIYSPTYFHSNGAELAEASLTGDINITGDVSSSGGGWAVIAGVVLRASVSSISSSISPSSSISSSLSSSISSSPSSSISSSPSRSISSSPSRSISSSISSSPSSSISSSVSPSSSISSSLSSSISSSPSSSISSSPSRSISSSISSSPSSSISSSVSPSSSVSSSPSSSPSIFSSISSSLSPSSSLSNSPSSSPSYSVSPSVAYSSFTKTQTTPFPVSEGGTGLSSLTNKGVLIGAGAGNVTSVLPGVSGNVLKSDGTSWSSDTINIADRSVDYDKLGVDLTQIVNLGSGNNVDWSLGGIYTKTLTEDTTLTFTNFKVNKSILLKITGNYSLTLPSEVQNITGIYDGNVINYIYLHCTYE